jgi:hypothetical protein
MPHLFNGYAIHLAGHPQGFLGKHRSHRNTRPKRLLGPIAETRRTC